VHQRTSGCSRLCSSTAVDTGAQYWWFMGPQPRTTDSMGFDVRYLWRTASTNSLRVTDHACCAAGMRLESTAAVAGKGHGADNRSVHFSTRTQAPASGTHFWTSFWPMCMYTTSGVNRSNRHGLSAMPSVRHHMSTTVVWNAELASRTAPDAAMRAHSTPRARHTCSLPCQ
jgi:hypothetical protein